MRASQRNYEQVDEQRERDAERLSEANVEHLELTVCRQAVQIDALEQQVRELSETQLARQIAYVIDRLGLRYAHDANYVHSAFTMADRRDLAEVLDVNNYAAERQEGSDGNVHI